MNVRKHLAGFALFSVILWSAILINHYLTRARVITPAREVHPVAVARTEASKPVLHYQVRQVALDYKHQKSYTEVILVHTPDQPAPEKVWVMTTFFSPDSTRAEDWSIIESLSQPFVGGDRRAIVLATSNWDLPPSQGNPKPGYFARVYVSAEYEGQVYQAEAQPGSGFSDPMPVVVHWPDGKSDSVTATGKFTR